MFPEPARLTLAELAARVGGRAAGDVDKPISGVTSLTHAGPSDLGLLGDGRYSHSRYVASFAGFGPVPDPRLVVIVCIDEPQPRHSGGAVAAPMFKEIMERLMSSRELDRSAPAGVVL